MKAVRLNAVGSPLTLEDLPDPVPGPGEVRVRVAGCGVCHTDIGFWRDGVPTRRPLPLTLGHEVSGTVDAAGEGAAEWLGREVIVPAVISCGACDLCREGRGNACRAQLMPGNDMDGGFADFIVVPARGLCHVRDRGGYALSELSVVADAVTTPYQAVVRSGLAAGELAIVIGVGGVGGYAVQIASAMGAKVVAIDVDDAKLALIAQHGAHATFNSRATDFKTLKKEIGAKAKEWGCPSHGAKVFECSGSTPGQETAYGLLGHAGTLMVVGFTLGKIEVRLSNLMAFDATVQGTWGCRPELYPDALAMVTSGRVTLKPFIERHPLNDGPEVVRRVADHEIHRRAILEPASR
ncbi:MAG: 6-hydroxycyclohex-1-ene-1-carbonyl-CoA dehydrogenase [Candidatus Eisenbacteria bacterium]|uniref:6-hydroxycyclohex-1-ene-1-carbonyl-CoA dehydrogenase n=1 Tax=Eiseniibacteriota bacterium TaxID=2212470 RepID=A0A933SD79_UNCEI|nr:6-hydroxycyclohex-1-ene-1-carbonyl-CoA dehydrogenase [Candidatus Eisenbacteria bacterium]